MKGTGKTEKYGRTALAQRPANRQIVREEIQANNGVIMEAMHDMQTELLRGIERFARGNFSRLHRLETSDNDLNERI